MRIAIVGAGGIGAPLGAALARSGADVTFVARGAHLAAMRKDGLRVDGPRVSAHIRSTQATDNPAEIGLVDIILSCVKLWDLETSAELLKPIIGSETVVIPLQNGVDASERIAPILGPDHVMGGVAMVTGSIVSPGVVKQVGQHFGIAFGELGGGISQRAKKVQGACAAAGIDGVASDDIQLARWDKFVGLAGAAGVCSLTRQSVSTVRDDPEMAPLLSAAIREIVDVGIVCGVNIGHEIIDKWQVFIKNAPAGMMPSMAVDLLAGNRLELNWLTGKVVELGRAHDVRTPVNSVIYAALKSFANGMTTE